MPARWLSLRYTTQGLANRTQLMAMGSRSVDLAKQALSSVHGKVSAAVQPIVILAFPDQVTWSPLATSGSSCTAAYHVTLMLASLLYYNAA